MSRALLCGVPSRAASFRLEIMRVYYDRECNLEFSVLTGSLRVTDTAVLWVRASIGIDLASYHVDSQSFALVWSARRSLRTGQRSSPTFGLNPPVTVGNRMR